MAHNKELKPSKTVLTIVVGFLIIYAITNANWALWIAIAIGVLGLLSSFIALKIQELWMGLGKLLSHIVPPVLLSVIFFLILFPIALLSRLFGEKDPLQLNRTNKSLFKTVDRPFTKSSFEKTW